MVPGQWGGEVVLELGEGRRGRRARPPFRFVAGRDGGDVTDVRRRRCSTGPKGQAAGRVPGHLVWPDRRTGRLPLPFLFLFLFFVLVMDGMSRVR